MNNTTPAKPAIPQTPFCAELRSKKFYMLDVIPTEESQYIDASGHCWCFKTHIVLGPDGFHAKPTTCVPGRSCYTSALA